MITPLLGRSVPERPSVPTPNRGQAAVRRNQFQVLFEETTWGEVSPKQTNPQPAVARTRSPFSPPGAEVRSRRISRAMPEQTRSAAAVTAAAKDTQPPTVSAAASQQLDPDLHWYSPIQAPLSLEPLYKAMRQAGLDPKNFQFDQLQSFETFPERPEYNYFNRQILIRGPNGSGLFDLGLALRTPWVTAVELRSYHIA